MRLNEFFNFFQDDESVVVNVMFKDEPSRGYSVEGYIRCLRYMLKPEFLNGTYNFASMRYSSKLNVYVYPATDAEDMQDENLPALNELLNEYPAILENLENDGIVTTAKLISLTARELRAVDRIGSTAICKIRTSLAKYGLHLKGEKL